MHIIRKPLIKFVLVAILAACGGKEDAPAVSQTPAVVVEIICSYAPSQSKVVSAIAGTGSGATIAAAAIAKAAGLTAVLHSSGAYIFTGASGYISGTIGAAVIAPVLVGVGVVAGGSAVTVELLCAPRNHPDLVAKIDAAAADFYSRAQAAAIESTSSAAPIAADLKKSAIMTGNDAIEYAGRKSVEFSAALKK